MWTISAIILVVIITAIVFEYRLKRPDKLILHEVRGKIISRSASFYPRHFCLALPKTTYSSLLNIEASAKGNLDIKIKLAVTVAASLDHISELIRIGGWNVNAVATAEKEFETFLESQIKAFTEKYEIEELSSDKIYDYLHQKVNISKEKLGLEIISLTVQSLEALDTKIADAMRQQESARILEQTELLNQKARIHATKAKLEADEEIAKMENALELKKYDLKKSEQAKESELAQKNIEDELKRKKLLLEYDSAELDLLRSNPELLMLSPQAARLAEASQSLKNAKTIVSLSPNDISQGIDLIGMFQKYLERAVGVQSAKSDEKKK